MMLKRNSIKYRLTLISVVSFLIIGLVSVYFIIQLLTGYMREQTFKNATNVLRSFDYEFIQKNKEDLLKQVGILAGSPQTAEWITQKDKKMLDRAFKPYLESQIVDFLLVRDQQIDLLKLSRPGIEFTKILDSRLGILIPHLIDASVWVDQDQARDLFIIAAAPVRNGRREILGLVIAGFSLVRSGYVDKIKAIHDLDATIFNNDLRIATTISQNGVRQLRTPLDPKIARMVLQEGKSFAGETKISGKPYLAIYQPITGIDGKPLGALFVGKSLEEFLFKRNEVAAVIVLLGMAIIIFGILKANFWHNRVVVKPITAITDALSRISEGDWTIPADFITNKKPDEIGAMKISFMNMVNQMRGYRERVEQIAYYDELTGLANQACLYEKYSLGSGAAPLGDKSALIFLDTDNLKSVNDVYGHLLGDKLLQNISVRITALTISRGYELFRLGGDKFVMVARNGGNIQEVSELAQGVISGFKEPFQIEGNLFQVSLSMGISISGDQGLDLAQMLKNAEIAMYQVKENGKNGFMFFDQSMDRIIKYKIELEQNIRDALLNQEFQLYYQPKIMVNAYQCQGFEALLRWEHPGKGWIQPDQFISLAEQTGLIVPLGEWVLKTACRFMKELNERMNSNFQVSVNVSVIQLMRGDFVSQIEKILNETGFSPQFLELEITESVLMESPEVVFDHLMNLRDKGVNIALDDFGKGYSSLTYLRLLPISTLKIDPSFVVDIGEKGNNGRHIQSYLIGDIIRLGHHMGLKVVAEGVENKSQLKYLRRNHCDLIQGYYFSKPLPQTEIISWLKKGLDLKDNLAI